MVNLPIPYYQYVDVPVYYLYPAIWFIGLWVFRTLYCKCECGAWYHTEQERKEFWNYFWFSILSTGVVLVASIHYNNNT